MTLKDITAEDVAPFVEKGQCILFLGAGVHYPPPAESPYTYPDEERPPLGRHLSEQLAKECEFQALFPSESMGNLQRVSLCYELTKTRKQLVDTVDKHVDVGKKPSPVLRALAELPFSLVMTTNYDRLFEKALAAVGKTPVVKIYNKHSETVTPDYPDPTPEEPFLFKIHGDSKDRESIVITDEDYIQFLLRMTASGKHHPIPQTFLYRLQTWPTLFVGYSLMDYNLRLLFKTLRQKLDDANAAQIYSVDPYPDRLIVDVWHHRNNLVTFIVEDVWKFVPTLYKLIKGKDMPL